MGEPVDDAQWRHIVNQYSGPDLPEDGAKAPDMEMKKTLLKDGESPVILQKIITEVYVYTSLNDKELWYGSHSVQDVQLLGKMRLSEALKIINVAKRKRRRR